MQMMLSTVIMGLRNTNCSVVRFMYTMKSRPSRILGQQQQGLGCAMSGLSLMPSTTASSPPGKSSMSTRKQWMQSAS